MPSLMYSGLRLMALLIFGLLPFILGPEPNTILLVSAETTSAVDLLDIPSECSNPVPDTCTFYKTCLEPRVHCGATGYPLGYGEKFCDLFMEDKKKFSEKGQKWIGEVGLCLQKSLVELATGPHELSCSDLRDFAFGTHTKCYIETGFCDQSFKDQRTLLGIVGISELFTDAASLRSSLTVFNHCILADLGLKKSRVYTGLHEDL